MLFSQNGSPSISYIRQILNVYYYSTGFPCGYIPNEKNTPNVAIAICHPLDHFIPLPHVDALFDTKKHPTESNRIRLNDTVYIYYRILRKGHLYGLIFSDISQAKWIQQASLLHLLGVCIRSDAPMKGNYPSSSLQILPTANPKISTVKHHPYAFEKKMFNEMLMTGTNPAASMNDYIFPQLGPNELRSRKNYAIIGISLYARTAIGLGLSSDMAYSISDLYITKVEECLDLESVGIIQAECIASYHASLNTHNPQYHPVVDDLLTYLETHLHSPFSLKDYAEVHHISYKYLSDLFNKHMGIPFPQYVRQKKIEQVIQLLKNPHTSITDIATQLGYTYPSHLNRDFKAVTGTTPKFYRQVLLSEKTFDQIK